MAVACGGTLYNGNCIYLDQIIETNPDSGFKKREQLKAMRHNNFTIPGNNTIWKTNSGEFGATFDTPNNNISGILTLTF